MALAASAVPALAGITHSWDYAGSQNAGAGSASVHTSFNTDTDQFTWNVSYSDGVARDTDGYWLVVGPGPNPKGHAFEYAIMYFDASNISAPVVSVYRYNGQNADNSWTTPGDLLASSITGVGGASIAASASQSGAARSFSLSLDATVINGLYGGVDPDWTGIQYGQHIGVWFHTVGGLTASYDQNGRLTQFNYARQGWIDLSNQTTIPGPAGLMALGMGLIATGRRRK